MVQPKPLPALREPAVRSATTRSSSWRTGRPELAPMGRSAEVVSMGSAVPAMRRSLVCGSVKT